MGLEFTCVEMTAWFQAQKCGVLHLVRVVEYMCISKGETGLGCMFDFY